MTRLKYLTPLAAGLVAASLPFMAAAQDTSQTFTVTPGLYEMSTSVIMSGQSMIEDVSQDCVREGENSKTLDELVEEVSTAGNCTLSNIAATQSTASADFICKPEGLPFEATGTMEIEHGPEFLDMVADGTMGFLGPVQFKTDARRIGECPVDAAAP